MSHWKPQFLRYVHRVTMFNINSSFFDFWFPAQWNAKRQKLIVWHSHLVIQSSWLHFFQCRPAWSLQFNQLIHPISQIGTALDGSKNNHNKVIMSVEYHIALHLKSPAGLETYGSFYVGSSPAGAKRFFRSLKGSSDEPGEGLLLMELRAIWRGLPIDIQMKYCTLDELTDNCRAIIKYLFNSFNPEKVLSE